jgi:hypothetical protein
MTHSIHHFHAVLTTLIADTCPELPRRAQRRLVFCLLGILLAGTLVLRRIASTYAQVCLASPSAPSHERRLRRSLDDPHLTWEQTYTRAVRRILQRPRSGPWWVLVDETGHTDRYRVLVAALFYRGRAVPLAWLSWPAQQPLTTSYWTLCGQLLDRVATVLPDGPVVVVGDRAFGCPAFIDQVAAHGWDWLVRVQGQTRYQASDGTTVALRDVLPTDGGMWQGRGQVFKKEGWRAASAVAYWRRGLREPLLLASSCPVGWHLVREYRRRSAIEALFRDWKSRGWQWEASQVRRPAHWEVLLVLLAWATLITLCLGEAAAQQVLTQAPQRGQRRPWAARDSLFRLGRAEWWRRLWQDDRTPIRWELAHADAPNWSTECWQAARPTGTPLQMTGRVGRREQPRAA